MPLISLINSVDPSLPSLHPGLSGGIYRLGPLTAVCSHGLIFGGCEYPAHKSLRSRKGLGLTMRVAPGGCVAWSAWRVRAALPSQLPSLFRKLLLLLLLEQDRVTGGKTREKSLGVHGLQGSQVSQPFQRPQVEAGSHGGQ